MQFTEEEINHITHSAPDLLLALYEIGRLRLSLRQICPKPEDLQHLYDSLSKAVHTADIAVAKVTESYLTRKNNQRIVRKHRSAI